MNSPIVAYFSHSYRPEDRAVNMAAWMRLNRAGIVFSVDPPDIQRPMDITFLERMMQRSNCFIGIIPRRSPAPGSAQAAASHSTWSPYQALEFRLALRANKPRLVIFERNMDIGPLPKGEPAVWFDRKNLEFSSNFETEIDRLVQCAITREYDSGFLPKIGLLHWKPADDAWARMIAAVQTSLKEKCEVLDVDDTTLDDVLLARARDMSVVVADINPSVTPAHVVGLLHGAAVPLYRACLVRPVETSLEWARSFGLEQPDDADRVSAAKRTQPRMLHGYQVDSRMQPVLFWTEADLAGTANTIVEVTNGYRERERTLEEHASGRDYFLSLRGNKVFISSPGDASDLTQLVKVALDDAGMPAFHYQVSQLQGGKAWKEQIESKVIGADLLLGFVSPTYWDRPECVEELALAVERWERHQMLLVLLYVGDQLPDLPPFLKRLQVNRATDPAQTSVRAVEELRRAFGENASASINATVESLADLVRRHVPDLNGVELAAWLHETCRIELKDAEPMAERVRMAADRAGELLAALLAAVQVERYRGAALGRLIYFLRGQERDMSIRENLSRLFSKLRLFPRLHDVKAWNLRRQRGQVVVHLGAGAPKRLLTWITSAAGVQPDRLQMVRALGAEMAQCVAEADRAAVLQQPGARVCAVGSAEDLMVPIEWAVFDGMAEPLSRARSVVRRVDDMMPLRARLEHQFHAGLTGPPRVLLFGVGASTLPHVPQELRAVEQCFADEYTKCEWPLELVERVAPQSATHEQLRDLLSGGDHEILHLACHAGFSDNEPIIELRDDASQVVQVRGEQLSSWLRGSMVRFVYLSCCQGAATDFSGERFAGWRQSLCKELLEAGVPEIVAYVWNVNDEASVRFTRTFYDAFVHGFDAANALHQARRASARSDPFWASSLLIQQTQADVLA